jgi:hypothetical protein
LIYALGVTPLETGKFTSTIRRWTGRDKAGRLTYCRQAVPACCALILLVAKEQLKGARMVVAALYKSSSFSIFNLATPR